MELWKGIFKIILYFHLVTPSYKSPGIGSCPNNLAAIYGVNFGSLEFVPSMISQSKSLRISMPISPRFHIYVANHFLCIIFTSFPRKINHSHARELIFRSSSYWSAEDRASVNSRQRPTGIIKVTLQYYLIFSVDIYHSAKQWTYSNMQQTALYLVGCKIISKLSVVIITRRCFILLDPYNANQNYSTFSQWQLRDPYCLTLETVSF